jgi:hypothetical protein
MGKFELIFPVNKSALLMENGNQYLLMEKANSNKPINLKLPGIDSSIRKYMSRVQVGYSFYVKYTRYIVL